MTLDQQIEVILFYKGEPVKINKLADILKKEEDAVRGAVGTLEKRLTGGLVIVLNNDEVSLGTSPEASSILEEITKEDLNRELGKAGLETLSIILYKGPISKKEIDYIRGVNSGFILRNLSIRGLVEKFEKSGTRSSYYKATTETLSFLGLKNIEELPDYGKVKEDIEKLTSEERNEEYNN